MDSSTSICVTVFLGLFAASVVMQWIRAKKRQKLVRMVDPQIFDIVDQSKWHSIDNGVDFLLKDFRMLQIVKKNSGKLPENLHVSLERYRRFSRAEILVTLFMFFFGSIAFLICN
jgi:hypothetical protein